VRTIAGLWPCGEGEIELHKDAKLMRFRSGLHRNRRIPQTDFVGRREATLIELLGDWSERMTMLL
jgi:hypothetical protein